MQCNPIDYLGPLSAARQETPPPNPGVPRAARSGVNVERVAPTSDMQLDRAAAVMPVQSQSDWKKSKARISQPRDPTKSQGGDNHLPSRRRPRRTSCGDVC